MAIMSLQYVLKEGARESMHKAPGALSPQLLMSGTLCSDQLRTAVLLWSTYLSLGSKDHRNGFGSYPLMLLSRFPVIVTKMKHSYRFRSKPTLSAKTFQSQ